ncbi:hypothetical protein WT24_24295 [Burkholderia sp. MSMB1078WGS]|uniref:hypothetical protein n=1 Tax=Burkholderia sp. MSMB1078WGS TaxID=1637900 RepID=UPI00075BE2FD|nr:hypothetical protein [Burkholderia sp. MSMB1078WGS]KVT04157.1 hypothetical protein WT24_24295 [Burkholderia sp. MSMB1078WGS]
MGRSADYTIQGFLYQFNQTLAELLEAADDDVISIEGIVEDIEVASYTGTKAIQCKYHETKNNYTPSVLYNPLLQMLKHFKSNPNAKIHYCLYAHFPGNPAITITSQEINEALKSKNKDLKELISELTDVDVEGFLKVFSFSITKKYDDLMEDNSKKLEGMGFNRIEIDTLFYPNSIQIIADLSIKHDANLRKITKKDFFTLLKQIRSTAISQWTLSLKTRQKLLETRRKQLKENLSTNARLRHIAIFPEFLEKFDDQIIIFIKSFIDKYHFKIAHTQTPLFALDISQDALDEIAERLIGKDIIPNLGRPVKAFSEIYFLRDPMIQREKKEFSLRIICWSDYKKLTAKIKADDLFAIGNGDISGIDIKDINIEILGSDQFEEIKYMMGISNAY